MRSSLLALFTLLSMSSCVSSIWQDPNQLHPLDTPQQIAIPGFDEPLIHLPTQSYRPLKTPLQVSGTDIERLLDYLSLNRNTPWEASIQLNLGLAYYRHGYFSKTFPAFERAWQLSRNVPRPDVKALADRAFGELVRMHARLGHANRLEALLATVKGRTFTGPATEKVAGATEGLWMMRHRPGITYLCGAKALASLLDWQHPGAEGLTILDAYRSGEHGINLSQLTSLAHQAGMDYRPVVGTKIPVPAVIHWQVNHYAAIVEKKGNLYHIKDPTFGQDLWLTKEAIDSQASGYFLVPASTTGDWKPVQLAQAEMVYGQGYTASSDEDRTTPCDQHKSKAPCDGTKPVGMASYDVHTMLVSLNITDTPLSYTPSIGHPIRFTLSYNQREANQPANFSFGNVGPKWTHNWLTYLKDSPTNASAVVQRIVAGGGAVNYSGYNASNGEYEEHIFDRARLFRVSADPIVYERRLPSGAREIYSVSDGAVSGIRRVFLSQKIDANGHVTTLHYDASLRLVTIIDALGQATVLAYEHPADEKLITQVTDPFERKTILEYDARGRLISITDPVGMVSAFTYDSGDFITAMHTPYGKTTFSYHGNGTSRTLVITDPMGEQERVEYGQALGISRYVNDVPKGDILTNHKWHDFRNTAYWDKQTYRDYGRDITKAEVSHWLHTQANKTSGLLETFKKPLENRIWYNYPGQTLPNWENNLTQDKHSRIGRVLDDGSSQVFTRKFNDYGKLTYQEDPLGHYVKYRYADNQIDLLQIIRLRNGSEETVATFNWDGRHNLLSTTDGLGHTTSYSYNEAGQLLTQTNSLGHVTRYEYDRKGYLARVTYPTGKTEQFSYDSVGRLASYTDTQGHTRFHTYDALNRPVRIMYQDGSFIEITWDKLDIAQVKDRLGRVTHYEYDALGRKIGKIDPLGRETHYTYDASSRLLSVTDPLGQVTRYEYDLQGRKTAKIDAEGHRTEYHYERTTSRLAQVMDAEGGTTDFIYDLANRLIAVTDPSHHRTDYTLDEVGNVLERISPDSGITLYRYDVMGLLAQKTDARGMTADYNYDALNRLQQIRYPDSRYDIEFSYDGTGLGADVSPERRMAAIGKLTGMRDPSGHTLWYYNLQGDIEKIDTVFLDLGRTPYSQHFEYDYGYEPGKGRLISYRYPNGQVFQYHYDTHGRVNGIDSISSGANTPVVSGVTYHPTAADGISGFTYGNGLSYQRQVDALGRIAELKIGKVLHRQWRYTPAGNIAAIEDLQDPNKSWHYGFDALHRLTDAKGPAHWSYQYDANGNRLRKNSALYTLDTDSNRLLEIAEGNEILQFQYDESGNRVMRTSNLNDIFNFEYDPQNRLEQVFDSTGELASYQYNGLGQRVIKATAQGVEYSLYNPKGQRITVLDDDGALKSNTFYWNGQPIARYDERYRFTSRHKQRPAVLIVDPARHHLQLTRYDGSILNVVIDDHLWKVVETRKGSIYYFSIGKGVNKRLKGWIHMRRGKFGMAHLVDKTQGRPKVYHLGGGRVMVVYFYHLDHLGTPQLMTDQNQTVVWQANYDPFGKTTLLSEVIRNDLRFPGQYNDQETGLNYNWFRYYDTETGSYIKTDPLGIIGGGLNSYIYANANPLFVIDPYGLYCLTQDQIDAIASGIGGGTGGLISGVITGAIVGGIPGAVVMGLTGAIRGAGAGTATAIAIQQAGVLGGASTAAFAENDRLQGKARAGIGMAVGAVIEDFLGSGTTASALSGAIGGAIGVDPVTGAIGGAAGGLVGSITANILAVGNDCKEECEK